MVFPYAPMSAVLPSLLRAAEPKKSSAAPSLAVSSACCDTISGSTVTG